jgi:Fe-S-cluster-containing hydrogenase component 2
MAKGKKGGALIVIECDQEIPCNPCETACPNKAIRVGIPINNRPRFYPRRCKACGKCIPICPGLAIFLFDPFFNKREALVGFPHEYLPLPEKNQEVDVVDRMGVILGRGRVIRIDAKTSNDRTPVVYVAVPRKIARRVRGMVRM